MTDELLAAGIGLLGALVGSGIGGICTVIASRHQANADRQKDAENEAALISGFLNAALDEIETLWNRYYESCGRILENTREDTPFLYFYPVFQEFFTVYTSNSSIIGRVKDDELRRSIVISYTHARGLVDSFRFNNVLFEKQQNAEALFILTKEEQQRTLAASHLDMMRRYGNTLRFAHRTTKEHATDLIRRLKIATGRKH